MKVSIIGKREPPQFEPSSIDEGILEATKRRKLVLLIGAGISRQAADCPPECFPNWRDLLIGLNDLNDSLGRRFSSEAIEIDDLINRGEFLMAAQHLKKSLSGTKRRYEDFLKKRFEPLGVKPGQIHDSIIQLNPPFVLTTNYDTLIETALLKAFYGTGGFVFTGAKSDQVLKRYKEVDSSSIPFVLKLHGCITDVEHIVLDYDSYVSLYNRREYLDLLTSIFLNYTVLMLGFSFSDPELQHFLGSLQSRFNKLLPNSYLFTQSVPVTSVRAQRFEEDFGVQVINYPKDAHSQILDLLNYLNSITNTASARI